ncbi:MAG: acetylornithine/succinylornithine family transaminase [Trueperaceae bacterium]|nr:acetylornithine/succinylornithine family transaminase [Trueperaceae bacterium]
MSTPTPSPTADLLARDARHASGLWAPDVAFVRGEGAWLWDADGKRYLDAMAGIAVASVGHANERLVEALAAQARRLIVCPQNLANDVRTEFVEALFAHLPAPLERVFLTNSGAEANEAALKWAFAATARRRVVAAKRGFAGRTLGALAMTWEAKYRKPFEPLAVPVDFVRFDDAAELEAAVGDETAMIWLEPVQGEGGVHPASATYLRRARELADAHGALLGFDEIQCGVGRTGRFLASEHAGVVPDLLVLAKGLAGGVPIGALVMTEAVARAMPAGGHGTTFGGNPLAAAAGLAVLQELDERGLIAHAAAMGARFKAGIEALGSDRVREVRGLGLMLGVELKEKAAPVIAALREAGLLTINAGATVVRFVPPLVITPEQVEEAVAIFGRVLRA